MVKKLMIKYLIPAIKDDLVKKINFGKITLSYQIIKFSLLVFTIFPSYSTKLTSLARENKESNNDFK